MAAIFEITGGFGSAVIFADKQHGQFEWPHWWVPASLFFRERERATIQCAGYVGEQHWYPECKIPAKWDRIEMRLYCSRKNQAAIESEALGLIKRREDEVKKIADVLYRDGKISSSQVKEIILSDDKGIQNACTGIPVGYHLRKEK